MEEQAVIWIDLVQQIYIKHLGSKNFRVRGIQEIAATEF